MEYMEKLSRESAIYRWMNGWMDGYIERQIDPSKKLIFNLSEPPAQGSCRGYEAPLRSQKQAPAESLGMAMALQG